MSVTGLNRLERGLQCVTAERLATLARLLEISADYLLGLTPDDPDATRLPPWTRRQPGPVPCERETALPPRWARKSRCGEP